MFVRATGTSDKVQLQPNGLVDSVSTGFSSVFNLTAQTATFTGEYGGKFTNISQRIEPYANGWFRISVTFTVTGTSVNVGLWWFPFHSGVDTAPKAIIAWGIQCETGSVATSYIPTAASTVTRAADSLSVSSLTNMPVTEGTMFVEGARAVGTTSGYPALFSMNNGGSLTGEEWIFQDPITGRFVGGGSGSTSASAVVPFGTLAKFGYALSNGTLPRGSLNGTGIAGASATGTLVSMNRVDIGQRAGANTIAPQYIRKLAIFPTRLSDSDLDALTS